MCKTGKKIFKINIFGSTKHMNIYIYIYNFFFFFCGLPVGETK